MYARADSGEIPDFPGVSAPYDEPASPDLLLRTDSLSIAECVERIVALLQARGVLG
jgi:adenylylsulfate kinase-like enzyme